MGPIKPEDVQDRRDATIPDAVFKVFNDLIVANWDGHRAVLKQDEVVGRIVRVLGIGRDDVFDRGYLDVEYVFRKAGWKVEYDKPGYNETYEATFAFSK